MVTNEAAGSADKSPSSSVSWLRVYLGFALLGSPSGPASIATNLANSGEPPNRLEPEDRDRRIAYWLRFLDDPEAASRPEAARRARRIVGHLKPDFVPSKDMAWPDENLQVAVQHRGVRSSPRQASTAGEESLRQRQAYWLTFANDPAVQSDVTIFAGVARLVHRLQAVLATSIVEPSARRAMVAPPLSGVAERIAYWKQFLSGLDPDTDAALADQIQAKIEIIGILAVDATGDETESGTALHRAAWLQVRLADHLTSLAELTSKQFDEDGFDEAKNAKVRNQNMAKATAQREVERLDNAFRRVLAQLPSVEALTGLRHDLGPAIVWAPADVDLADGILADLFDHGLMPQGSAEGAPDLDDWHVHFAEPPFYPALLFARIQARADDAGPAWCFALDEVDGRPPQRLDNSPDAAYRLNAVTELALSEETAPLYASMIVDFVAGLGLSQLRDGTAIERRAEADDAGYRLRFQLAHTAEAMQTTLLIVKRSGRVILENMMLAREG